MHDQHHFDKPRKDRVMVTRCSAIQLLASKRNSENKIRMGDNACFLII